MKEKYNTSGLQMLNIWHNM